MLPVAEDKEEQEGGKGDDSYVTIHESITEIGHRVWDTSPLMAKFFEKHASLVHEKSVLELGSGTGLLGIFLALCGCRQLVLTDSTRILKRLECNVTDHANLFESSRRRYGGGGGGEEFSIKELDWTNRDQIADHANVGYDIIICSDLIITERDTTFLGHVLSNIAHPGKTVIYLGSPVHREGYIQLLKLLKDSNSMWFRYKMEMIDEADLHPDYRSHKIKILKLVMKTP